MATERPISGHRGDDESFAPAPTRGRFASRTEPRWEWMLGPLVAVVVVAMAVIGITRAGTGESSIIPSIAIECPSSVPVGERLACTIATDDVVSGNWELPGFLPGPLELEIVNDDNPIYVEPTNPDVAGQDFTITATAFAEDGSTVTATHTFRVVAG